MVAILIQRQESSHSNHVSPEPPFSTVQEERLALKTTNSSHSACARVGVSARRQSIGCLTDLNRDWLTGGFRFVVEMHFILIELIVT